MKMKNIFIMGDSYSTYRGYIPKGYGCYYSEDRADKPFVTSVTKTWWKIFEKENGHPTELGMKQIAEQLTDFLNK